MTICWSGRVSPQPTSRRAPAVARRTTAPPVVGKGLGLEIADHRRLRDVAAGNDQRRLGQAVTGIKRLAAEAAGREDLGEAIHRLGAHRLGAVEGHLPTAQVERLPLLGGDLLHAQVVGEVRPAAGRGRETARSPTASDRASARNDIGDISTLGRPMYSGCKMPPISPMSW